MKIAIGQIKSNPGDFEANTKKIIQYIESAKSQGAEIVTFPELAVPGYMSMDLVLEKGFSQKNKESIEEIAKHTQGITAIVGFIDEDQTLIGADDTPTRYNSAAIIRDQKIIGIQDKTLLPEYDIFSEKRYFAPSRGIRVFEIGNNTKIGVQICEDLWDTNYPTKVSRELVNKGAQFIFNLSASPFQLGKISQRQKLIEKISSQKGVSFIYTNLVGSYDGYDGQLVFDGRSLVYNLEGKLIAIGNDFDEDLLFVDTNSNKEIQYNPDSNEELFKALTYGIKEYFEQTGFKKAFIGLSGGVDSGLVAPLAVEALGKENVKGVLMPSEFSSQGSIDDAIALSENLGIEYSIVPIKDTYNSMVSSLSKDFNGKEFDVTEENIQARIRGMILMAQANKFNGLVLSTGNKTETSLGYSTLYGDMAGGLSVIADLDKLRVYELAKYINKVKGKEIIPQNTLDKAPSAELRTEQTDEAGLGAPYSVLVPIVNGFVENRKTKEELYETYPKKVVDDCYRRIKINEHKRRQAAPGIRVTSKSFGIGRRIPISHSWG